MKSKLLILLSLAAVALLAPARAHDDHKHHHAAPAKKIAGPNGGRVLTNVSPRAELLVTPDRKIQITFLDAKGQAVAPAAQTVTVTTGDRAAPTTLSFAPAGNTLLSTAALPAGNNLPAVVQIKTDADAKPIVARFHLNLEVCGDCKYAEYACTCDH